MIRVRGSNVKAVPTESSVQSEKKDSSKSKETKKKKPFTIITRVNS